VDEQELIGAARCLRRARRVVVFSGAGISAESGIATFRDADGFWQRFPPQQFATLSGLLQTALRQPQLLAEFLQAVIEPIGKARPNAAHRAVAELEQHAEVTVVTQNIDSLHQAAGSSRVHEIHGTLFEIVTRGGRLLRRLSRDQLEQVAENLQHARQRRMRLARTAMSLRPVLGIGLRGLYRPKVVLFSEALIEPAWSLSEAAASTCDCLITVGASGLVYPAATIPQIARRSGARLVSVDPAEGTGADFWLQGAAGAVLPALLRAAYST
jgi:NAD-dependent deacetylase